MGGPAAGQVVLTLPRGGQPAAPESLAFTREGETQSVTVTATPPAGAQPGSVELRAAVLGQDGRRSEGTLAIIDYPHIRPRPAVQPSTAEIRLARIPLSPRRRVGYLRGAPAPLPE